jgi:hypothetical protein
MSSFDHNPRDNNNTDIVMSDDVDDRDFDFGSLYIMNSNQPAVVEVTLVANTPLRPPPLPEPPPPSISDNINNGYEYSVTLTDGEKLLFRSMYRVQVPNDKAMNILHDEAMKEYNDVIAITQLQLVVLYHFHLSTTAPATAPDTDTTGRFKEFIQQPFSSCNRYCYRYCYSYYYCTTSSIKYCSKFGIRLLYYYYSYYYYSSRRPNYRNPRRR